MSVRVRPIREEDLSQVLQIELDTSSAPRSREFFLDVMELGLGCFVVADGFRVLGHVVCVTTLTQLHLTHLLVAANARRQGHGRRLLEYCITVGRSIGAESIHVRVAEDNVVARRLYSRCGFQVVVPDGGGQAIRNGWVPTLRMILSGYLGDKSTNFVASSSDACVANQAAAPGKPQGTEAKLRVSRAQWDALGNARDVEAALTLQRYFRQAFSTVSEAYPDRLEVSVITASFARSREYGIVGEDCLGRFSLLMLLLGEDFDYEPRMHFILSERLWHPSTRLDHTFAWLEVQAQRTGQP